MSALISRDPFARQELHRRTVYTTTGETCKWCGNVRHTKSKNYLDPNDTRNNSRRFLYCYTIEDDSGRKSDIRGLYCSVSCMRAYNE